MVFLTEAEHHAKVQRAKQIHSMSSFVNRNVRAFCHNSVEFTNGRSLKQLTNTAYKMTEHKTQDTIYVQSNSEAHSHCHFCRGKAASITFSQCAFAALVIQHAKRMRFIILVPVVCLVLPYFPILFHTRHDFRK